MTKHCLALAIAAMLPFTASAAKLACKASVQDGRGIATAWVTVDGASVVPTKASFVFPPGRIAVDAGAGSGYVLGKPPQLPEGTLFLLAQYAIIANGNNLRIGLDQVEIDGPAYLRKDRKPVEPLFVLTTDGKSVLPETAVRDGELHTLRLHPRDGKSSQGDVYLPEDQRSILAGFFDSGDMTIAAGELHNGKAIYKAVIPMTDSKTIQAMLVAAMKKAAAAAPAGCQALE